MAQITLAGNEPAAFEKLDAAMAHAVEAAERMLYRSTCEALRHAVEGATELGTMRSDGRYARLATKLDEARVSITGMTQAAFNLRSVVISEQLASMRRLMQAMANGGRVVH